MASQEKVVVNRGYSKHFSVFADLEGENWVGELIVVNPDGELSKTHRESSFDLGNLQHHEVRVILVALINKLNMRMQDLNLTPNQTWELFNSDRTGFLPPPRY